MKTSPSIRQQISFALFALAFPLVLSDCTGKSNSEDDTFRQSIIDNPTKAVDENEHAKLNQKKPKDTLAVDSLNRK
jgi:hypothetical protein